MKPEAFRTQHFRISILLLAIILVAAFFAKLGWDEYQQNRAAQQAPKVREIFEQIQQMPDAVDDGKYGESSMGTNEYSAVLWRSYKSKTKCSEIRSHFDSEASRQSFVFSNEYESYGGHSFEYRNDEFEIRVQCKSDGYAFSVNWSGLGREAD